MAVSVKARKRFWSLAVCLIMLLFFCFSLVISFALKSKVFRKTYKMNMFKQRHNLFTLSPHMHYCVCICVVEVPPDLQIRGISKNMFHIS